jgi:F-type H+-transporting ATPase subunit gamma
MANNLKAIKKRTKSAQNIGQITKAMEMVAASKMRKAQKKALESKLYSQKIYELTASLMKDIDSKFHPLLRQPKNDDKPLLVLISTNRGLCGSLNLNLFRFVQRFLMTKMQNKEKIDFLTVGKKGFTQIIKMEKDLIADFSDAPRFSQTVAPIIQITASRFLQNQNTSVWLVYNDFVNALRQEPRLKKILPLKDIKLKIKKQEEGKKTLKEKKTEFLIEPSPKKIIDTLLPFYLESQVREAIFEAEASEHSARMLAMKNASDNALELVEGLTLEYNKARQQAVTTEISDIVTAKISMEVK